MSRLRQAFKDKIRAEVQEKCGIANIMDVPRLEKIVLNMGLGADTKDSKMIAALAENMTIIAGQKSVITKARVSVANFKIREGMSVGCKVTLRGSRMYDFLDRLINISIPRMRDFRGLNQKSFDGRGNYAMGINEQLIFPELEYDKVPKIQGMDIIMVTSAKTDEEGRELLRLLGMPFKTN